MWTKEQLSWEDKGRNNLRLKEGVIIYYLNSRKVCEVILDKIDLNQHSGYRGYIYPENIMISSTARWLMEDDLDVLKLKCLLKAKEMGWDIKEIT